MQDFIEVGEIKLAVIRQPNPADFEVTFCSEHLPRHDVGVVFHVGEHNCVSCTQIGFPPREGDKVEALGSVLGKDDRFRNWCVNEAGNFCSGAFEVIVCFGSHTVRRTVNGGVVVGQEIRHRIDDHLRFLSRVRRIEIHHSLAVYASFKKGKIVLERRKIHSA